MVLSRALRQQHVLRALNPVPRSLLQLSKHQRRYAHRVPALLHGEEWSKNGIGELISVHTYQMAWTDYQSHLINKLNEYTEGTVDHNATSKTLAIKYARQADKAALFNYASMAHNNHFFFSGLLPTKPSSQAQIPDHLVKAIENSFSSLESLRQTFIATAKAMFGPGFVWLVALKNPGEGNAPSKLAILNTYIAGTPYPGAHSRQQSSDMNTFSTGVQAGEGSAQYARRAGYDLGTYGMHGGFRSSLTAGFAGRGGRNQVLLGPGSQELEPIMCVNTWEHVWMSDYNVDGKEWFLHTFWDMIDWQLVSSRWSEVQGQGTNRSMASIGHQYQRRTGY